MEAQLAGANTRMFAMEEQLKKVNTELRQVKSNSDLQGIHQNRTIETVEKRLSIAEVTMANQQQEILQIKLDHEAHHNKTIVRLNDLNVNVTTAVQSVATLTTKVNVS